MSVVDFQRNIFFFTAPGTGDLDAGAATPVGIYNNDVLLCKVELVLTGPCSGNNNRNVSATFANDDSRKKFWQEIRHLQANNEVHLESAPRLPGSGQYSDEARQERLVFLRKHTGANLDLIEKNCFDPDKLNNNVEAFIGSVEIPIGVAGPLQINFSEGAELLYAPFATTEGTLVASATRGALALTQAGGVNVIALEQRITRVPVFEFDNLKDALFFADWIEAHYDHIRDKTREVSRRAELKYVEAELFGRNVNLHFVYSSGDAAGQNMTTATTWHACTWIRAQFFDAPGPVIRNFMIEVNSSDKRVSHRSLMHGRGTRVIVECLLPATVVRQVLKIEPKQLLWGYRNFAATISMSGAVGININIANAIAAIFSATGQDLACVHESSLGLLQIDSAEDDAIYASLLLPGLLVGTVGGGTGLAPQHQGLSLIGCAGNGKSARLTQIIGAFCLGLDLSTLSAVAAGHFADAHERMGRNRPGEVTGAP